MKPAKFETRVLDGSLAALAEGTRERHKNMERPEAKSKRLDDSLQRITTLLLVEIKLAAGTSGLIIYEAEASLLTYPISQLLYCHDGSRSSKVALTFL